MAGFAIEDGIIKNLTNTLAISKILILTCILGALGLSIFAKLREKALYTKDMLGKDFWLLLVSDCFRH